MFHGVNLWPACSSGAKSGRTIGVHCICRPGIWSACPSQQIVDGSLRADTDFKPIFGPSQQVGRRSGRLTGGRAAHGGCVCRVWSEHDARAPAARRHQSAIDCVHALQHAETQPPLRRNCASEGSCQLSFWADHPRQGSAGRYTGGRRLASVCHDSQQSSYACVPRAGRVVDKTRNGCQAFGGMILVRMSHQKKMTNLEQSRAQQAFLRSVRSSFANSIDHATASAVGADPASTAWDILGEFTV